MDSYIVILLLYKGFFFTLNCLFGMPSWKKLLGQKVFNLSFLDFLQSGAKIKRSVRVTKLQSYLMKFSDSELSKYIYQMASSK